MDVRLSAPDETTGIRNFREAAAEYLTRHAERRGIGRDVTALQNLDSYIGAKYLDEIYDETFQPFRDERAKEGICVGTVDRDIGTAARVLEEAATKYRDEVTKLTWLRERPYINYARPYKKREPYPLDWDAPAATSNSSTRGHPRAGQTPPPGRGGTVVVFTRCERGWQLERRLLSVASSCPRTSAGARDASGDRVTA